MNTIQKSLLITTVVALAVFVTSPAYAYYRSQGYNHNPSFQPAYTQTLYQPQLAPQPQYQYGYGYRDEVGGLIQANLNFVNRFTYYPRSYSYPRYSPRSYNYEYNY